MANLSALLVGLLFGIGLLLSGMVNPAKVLAFLDVAGAWDPSLAMVMLGAVAVAALVFPFAKRMPQSVTGTPIQLPTATRLDRRLLLGSALFGIGWGLAGFCPGPAVVSLGAGELKALIFVLAMLIGMGLFHLFEHLRDVRTANRLPKGEHGGQ